MTAKGMEDAQGCTDPVCYPLYSTEVSACAGIGCWAGQMTPDEL